PIFGVQKPNGTFANSPRCNRKSVLKMAASTPEVVIFQLLDKIATPSQRLTQIVWVRQPNMPVRRIVPDVTGSQFFKMAVYKPEVLIYQLPYKIATPFQMLTPIFGVRWNGAAIKSES